MRLKLIAAALVAVLASPVAAATVNATVDFNDGTTTGGAIKTYVEDGFQFYDARIVGGPCEFAGADKCAALNPLEVTVLTRVDGGAFDLTAIWFYLNGKVAEGLNSLKIFDTNNASNFVEFTQPAYVHNTGYNVALNFLGVTSITFESGGTGGNRNKGNARFDSLELSYMTPVPLPAAGWVMLAGLGGLAALRKRKSA